MTTTLLTRRTRYLALFTVAALVTATMQGYAVAAPAHKAVLKPAGKAQQDPLVPGHSWTAPAAPTAPAVPTQDQPVASGTTAISLAGDLAPTALSDRRFHISAQSSGATTDINVQIIDAQQARTLGLPGPALRLTPSHNAHLRNVRISIAKSALNASYGADYADRVRWATVANCESAATCAASISRLTPAPATSTGTGNNGSTTISLALVNKPILLAATATTSTDNGTGTFAATDLKPSSEWQVSGQSGDFTWTYPLRVPPAAAGPAPTIGLNYDSGTIDGETASTNNQTSPVGDGWQLSGAGYIERSYASCSDDGVSGSFDLCWKSDNATLSLGGQSGTLIKDGANVWHLQNDDGSKIEKLTGAGNGAYNGEYWRLTNSDGTQYYFGLNHLPGWTSTTPDAKNTHSAWTVPVAGNNSGEPCYNATFNSAFCTNMGWRWNLDYVVDTHGNAMSYHYAPETAHYDLHALKTSPQNFTPYIRGGTLSEIDYGFRDGSANLTAPESVTYGYGLRCKTTTNCDSAHPANMPDVPWDQSCTTAATCATIVQPSFWSTQKLSSVQTSTVVSGAATTVDRWSVTQDFTAPSDGSSGALRLLSIGHAGTVGGTATMPTINFTGTEYQNRVTPGDGYAPFMKERLTSIHLDTGGYVYVNYTPAECSPTNLPASPQTDTKRCFEQRWTPTGGSERTEYFNKYPVASVIQNAVTGGSGAFDQTYYDYSVGTPAWRLDTSPLTPDSKRTWSAWAGYGKVRVNHGDTNIPSQQTSTETTFFQGLDGDINSPTGGTRSVSLTASGDPATTVTDSLWFAGQAFESITRNGVGGAIVSDAINTPWASGPTATVTTTEKVGSKGTAFTATSTARYTGNADQRTVTSLASGGTRTTEKKTGYDSFGRVTSVDDLGDVATTDDDQCTRTTYADNTTNWNRDSAAEIKVLGTTCSNPSPVIPNDVISDTRLLYDNATTFGTPPTKGDVTKSQVVTSYDQNNAPVFTTMATNTYDGLGRKTKTVDEMQRTNKIDYTPAYDPAHPTTSIGPLTTTVDTNTLGWTTTTGYATAWGLESYAVDEAQNRTDSTFDPLGRRIKVWLPDRPMASNQSSPSLSYAYVVSQTQPTSVATTSLTPSGATKTAYQLYDGLLRPRQTQSPADGVSGAAITDTLYDSAGRAATSNAAYYAATTPSGTLWVPDAQSNIPSSTVTSYDGVGRTATTTLYALGAPQWHTSYSYGGNYTQIAPPDGGTTTRTYTDARGKTSESDVFQTADTTGPADKTYYTYDHASRLTHMTDAAGNIWSWYYDILGRKWKAVDPNSGTTTITYDTAGRVQSSTDADNNTLAYTYDDLNRELTEHSGSTDGPTLAAWTYDTVVLGQPASNTRYVDGQAYTRAITGYDAQDRALGSTTTFPGTDGLANTYTSSSTYNPDGSVASQSDPPQGGLPAETINYTYDALSNLTSVAGRNQYLTNLTYSATGRLTQTTHSNGLFALYDNLSYDPGSGRLTEDSATTGAATNNVVADHAYTYNNAGALTSDTSTSSLASTDTQCYQYDYAQQLTKAWTPTTPGCADSSTNSLGGPAPYYQTYSYDAVGNRTRITRNATTPGGLSLTDTYSYPPAGATSTLPNSVQSVLSTPSDGSSSTSTTFGYDHRGNTTTRPGEVLTWDAEGRLASTTFTADNAVQTNIYDAAGQLLVRSDPDGSKTVFLGDTEIRLDAGGKLAATRTYVANGSAIAVRTTKAGLVAGSLSWLNADNHGTAEITMDPTSGQTVTRYFDPFGNARDTAAPTWPDKHGFLNAPVNAATSTVHLGARDYDPALGRFLSVDPVFDPATPQQDNGYSYAWNNPISRSDVTGTDPAPSGCTTVSCYNCYYSGRGCPADGSSPTGNGGSSSGGSAGGSSGGSAGAPGDTGGGTDYTTRHNQAVAAAVAVIKAHIALLGLKGKVRGYFRIPGAAKKCLYGNSSDCSYGVPDIVFDQDTGVSWVWEVKSASEASKAQSEAQWYVSKMNQNPQEHAVLGWAIGGPYGVVTNKDEIIGPSSGAIIYGKPENKKYQNAKSKMLDPMPAPGEQISATPSAAPSASASAPSSPTAAPPEAVPGQYPGTAYQPGAGIVPLCQSNCGGANLLMVLFVASLVPGAFDGEDEVVGGGLVVYGTERVGGTLVRSMWELVG